MDYFQNIYVNLWIHIFSLFLNVPNQGLGIVPALKLV